MSCRCTSVSRGREILSGETYLGRSHDWDNYWFKDTALNPRCSAKQQYEGRGQKASQEFLTPKLQSPIRESACVLI